MASPRQLGDVDQLHVGAEVVEQLAGREPVRDDDVGAGEGAPRGLGGEVGVAGSATDQHHPGRGGPVRAGLDPTVAQRGDDLVAHPGRATWFALGQDGHAEAAVARDGRGPRAGGVRVVGAHAEGPATLGPGEHGRVDLGVVGRGHDVPRLVEVAVLEGAGLVGDLAEEALQGRGEHGRHHHHVGPGGDQRRHPTLGHGSAAHHHDAAPGEAQADGVRVRRGGHGDHCRACASRSGPTPLGGAGVDTIRFWLQVIYPAPRRH